MSRLTEKRKEPLTTKWEDVPTSYYRVKGVDGVAVDEIERLNKLGKLEDLEEEIGCPLEVVRQLFKQDFIYFKYLGNIQIMKVKVCKGLSYGTNLGWYVTCIYDNIDFEYISLKDYKKTWWLKKDKSE